MYRFFSSLQTVCASFVFQSFDHLFSHTMSSPVKGKKSKKGGAGKGAKLRSTRAGSFFLPFLFFLFFLFCIFCFAFFFWFWSLLVVCGSVFSLPRHGTLFFLKIERSLVLLMTGCHHTKHLFPSAHTNRAAIRVQ